MTDLDNIPSRHQHPPDPGSPHEASRYVAGAADPDRLVELERENSRLHRLVAELLIKNERLRKAD